MGSNNGFYISLEDNGIGFDIDKERSDKRAGKGLGLYSIENRAGLLGARLEFERQPVKGIKITLTLPMEQEIVN
jgi:two-component system sensor histidine kinase UhpB